MFVTTAEKVAVIRDRLRLYLRDTSITDEIAAVPDLAALQLLLDKLRKLYWKDLLIGIEVAAILKFRVLELVVEGHPEAHEMAKQLVAMQVLEERAWCKWDAAQSAR